jgi:hypothetical protein
MPRLSPSTRGAAVVVHPGNARVRPRRRRGMRGRASRQGPRCRGRGAAAGMTVTVRPHAPSCARLSRPCQPAQARAARHEPWTSPTRGEDGGGARQTPCAPALAREHGAGSTRRGTATPLLAVPPPPGHGHGSLVPGVWVCCDAAAGGTPPGIAGGTRRGHLTGARSRARRARTTSRSPPQQRPAS